MKNREDWLCKQLDSANLTEAVRKAYEAELDAMAEKHTIAVARQKQVDTQNAVLAEQEKLDNLISREKKMASALDMSYDEWLKIAKSLYTISGNTVTSIARGPENAREWIEESAYDARERVFKLIYWKYYDHFVRGGNFTFVPEEKETKTA